jgi:hypothetical protein
MEEGRSINLSRYILKLYEDPEKYFEVHYYD